MISILNFILLGISLLLLLNRDKIEDFCIAVSGRVCTKKSRCVATPEDIDNALNYAHKKVCESHGYKYVQYDEGFDCLHTEETCKRDTRYPSTDDKQYIEWTYDDECMVGMEKYRDYCVKKGGRYDDRSGFCYITEAMCKPWGADYVDGDCKIKFGQKLSEGVLGTTLVRGAKTNPITDMLVKTMIPPGGAMIKAAVDITNATVITPIKEGNVDLKKMGGSVGSTAIDKVTSDLEQPLKSVKQFADIVGNPDKLLKISC